VSIAKVIADMRKTAQAHEQWAMSPEASSDEAATSTVFASQIKDWIINIERLGALSACETAPAPTCHWMLEHDGEYYDTQCGQAFVMLNGGTPAEHKMQFCAYCGGKLIVGPLSAIPYPSHTSEKS
jgi:hypothetical protein